MKGKQQQWLANLNVDADAEWGELKCKTKQTS